MKIHSKNLKIFFAIFLIEILITQTSGFARHTFGDFLVVIMLYYLVKSFFNFSVKSTAISILLFSYTVEFLQYVNLVNHLGLSNFKLANIIISNTFSIGDLIAYTMGIITVLILENRRYKYEASK
ncbi:DUF2809 domain-containing protein [uncultured Tenacibaculum sp.]|uniref:ribosomal maturation YjgA family protein n=1 Tax=uncultured Tenacibaculum sp. TaxID=174713 RepID=UPI0026218DFE|nr:DUF2809 domain-containing protein [uncultured Tenacibaculum sp.]